MSKGHMVFCDRDLKLPVWPRHPPIIQVEYKKDLENTKGHSINYCETPQFKNVSKIAKYTSDVSASSMMW